MLSRTTYRVCLRFSSANILTVHDVFLCGDRAVPRAACCNGVPLFISEHLTHSRVPRNQVSPPTVLSIPALPACCYSCADKTAMTHTAPLQLTSVKRFSSRYLTPPLVPVCRPLPSANTGHLSIPACELDSAPLYLNGYRSRPLCLATPRNVPSRSLSFTARMRTEY